MVLFKGSSMLLTEFYMAIESDPQLLGIGIDGDIIYVKYTAIGGFELITQIDAACISEHPWDLLHRVLVGDLEPKILTHMSRIVGYFSRIDNWNASKLAELKDRQGGNYAV